MNLMPELATETEEARYVRLDARAGWRAALLDNVRVDGHGTLRLVGMPGNGRPLVDAYGSFGGLSQPTGIAVDPWDRIYLLDGETGTIKRYDPCCGAFETLPSIGGIGDAPRQLRAPGGIAVTKDHLIVVDSGNRRVQVFSLKGLALVDIWGPLDADGKPVQPTRTRKPDGSVTVSWPVGTWEPFDVVVDARGRAYVSDRANGRVHVFSHGGKRIAAWDGAVIGTPFSRPTHLALDGEGRLYVVQEGVEGVVIFDRDGEYAGRATAPDDLRGRFRPGPIATDTAGNLYVADIVSRELHCYTCCDTPGIPVRYTGAGLPFEGPVAGLAFDADGRPLVLVGDADRVVVLDGPNLLATEGAYFSAALDSGLALCQWHRIVLSGALPQGTSVRVQTHCADIERDDEEIAALPEDAWAGGQTWSKADAAGEWDCMVLSAPGRYLWLRLTFLGTGAASPAIDYVHAVFPRLSSAQYLPAVYRAAPGNAFLERFLSLFDTLFSRVEDRLDLLAAYFDPCATPAEFLSWLASWLDIVFEGTWDESRRRDVLACAVRLYAYRGTPQAIRDAVRIIAGLNDCKVGGVPGVLEDFQLRRWWFLGGSTLGDQTTLWGKRIVDRLQLGEHSTIGEFKITDVGDPLRDPFQVYAHKFSVFFPAALAREEGSRRAIERIIEASKPAHTQHRLEFVEPRFRVGVQATIGMDAVIGGYPVGPIITGEAKLGYGTVLADSPPVAEAARFRIGGRSALGMAVL